MSLSTHVLDTALGRPAAGVNVLLVNVGGDTTAAVTDPDGRATLTTGSLQAGTHQLVFATAEYFAESGRAGFYPQVTVAFTVTDPDANHHVPLLVSPYAYTTYRGS